MFKPLHVKGVVYLVDTQGNIIRGLDEKEVVPYLKAKKEPTGVSALRKMGADEERIQEYINRIKELKEEDCPVRSMDNYVIPMYIGNKQ